jgi:DNA-binding transcriptional LysR family regulator
LKPQFAAGMELNMDRFTGLEVFAKVVEGASFAAAGRRLGMSPAMVTKHVQTLEERLGVRLLNRTTHRVSATEVGKSYYEYCQRILAELEEADGTARDLQTAPRGLLKVTAPVSFGTRQLAPGIAEYLASYPEVSIDLSLENTYVDLLEKRFDLAIRLGHLPSSSLIARKLGEVETILCASPGYLQKHDTPQTPHDLDKHNCLIYTSAVPQTVWTFVDQSGKQTDIRVSGRFLTNGTDAICTLALKDAGVALVADFLVADDLTAGRLLRLLPEYATQATPIYAVYPHSRYLSAKARTFIDFLALRFARWPKTKQDGTNGNISVQAPASLRAIS